MEVCNVKKTKEEKRMEDDIKRLQEMGVKDIEMVTVEIPSGQKLKAGETRTYTTLKADYMLSNGGELDGVSGIKFEMVREDIGLVVSLVELDIGKMTILRDLLTHIIDHKISKGGMYQ
jgi:hypothetical protein